MAYTQYTLNNLADQLGNTLDDPRELYWTRPEKLFAVKEALKVWGAYTAYWRTRGVFDLEANQPFYDLSEKLPLLRPRTYSVQDAVQEIQYHCLEAANGVTGVGMSGQISIQSILDAVTRARNRFVIDSMLPLSVCQADGPAAPDGVCTLNSATVYVHRAGWLDATSGQYSTLWRQDEWAWDKGQPLWTQEPGLPRSFSEAMNSPLHLQLYPPPVNQGSLEIISSNAFPLVLNMTLPYCSFLYMPDEWCHGIKYAALNDLFGSGMIEDPVRAQYCETRYQQAVSAVKNIRTISRVMVNGANVPLDTLNAIDAGDAYWRNKSGRPRVCGAMHDFLTISPVPDQRYSAQVDVIASAPVPCDPNDYVQIGQEELDNILDYCVNYLQIKCGGKNLQDTFDQYDSFMAKVSQRKANNDVKILYMSLLDQPEQEEKQRPTISKPKRNKDPENKG